MKIYSAQLKGTTTVATGSNVSLTGSFTGSIYGFDDTIQYSSSVDSRIVVNTNRLNNIESTTASFSPRVSNLESKSSSVDISISNINSFTASNGNTSLNQLSGSLATTGSNTFFGTQTFSGSVYIANNLVVQGSSSIQYISASSVSIGTNIVQLNTANPSVRFAGLTMIDSGSIGGSGSFLYDSLQDEFIFVHRGNGTNITSSHFVLGPETYDSLGNEVYLTCNIISKGTGKEHLVDSCIFDNGTTVCVNATLKASGQVCSLMGNFGCVGIGTTAPSTPLHISTTGLPAMRLTLGSEARVHNISGVNNGRDLNISPFRHFSVQTGNGIAEGQITLNAYEDIILGTGASYTPRLTILGCGNVGIGSSSPGSTLPIGGGTIVTNGWEFSGAVCASRKVVEIDANDNNGGNVGLFLRQPNNSTGLDIWSDSYYGNTYIDSRFDNSASYLTFRFRTNCSNNIVNAMAITAAGNVGIGTCTPDSNSKTHIAYSGNAKQGLFVQNTGSDEATIRFKSAHSVNSDFRIGASIAVSNSFEIYSVNAACTRLYIEASSGNLGVKTTSIPAFSSFANILKVGSQAAFGYFGSSGGGETWILNNAYFDGSSWKGINSSTSAQIIKLNDNNEIRIFNNSSVTANTTFTPTQLLTVTNCGVIANQVLRVRAGQSADTIADDSPLAVSKSGTSSWVSVFDRNSTSSATGVLLRNGRNTGSNDSPFLTTEANHPDCGGTSTTPKHRLWSNGNGTCSGAWTGGGADYAEFFEWEDGNPNNENRVGYPVSLVGNKIKIAEEGETIIGIISASPSVIGDDGLYWKKKFLTNDLGEYILDENGGQVINPEFDSNIPYIPRSERKEWAIVGLMGKIKMKKGQLTMPNWIKMRDITDTVEEWLVK